MFELALALGEWDVDAIAESMPLGLYHEWRAYARFNPIGQVRDDWNAAMIASVVSNTLVSLFTKSRKRIEIKDLMFRTDIAQQKKTPKQMYMMIRTYAMQVNNEARRQRGDA